MGQGFFCGYFWGILQTEEIGSLLYSDDGIHDDFKDLVSKLGITIIEKHESKIPWIGFLVADSDGNLRIKQSPDGSWESLSYIVNYSAYPVEYIEFHLRKVASVQFLDAEQKWTEFATEFERITGVKLPDSKLLVVHGFD